MSNNILRNSETKNNMACCTEKSFNLEDLYDSQFEDEDEGEVEGVKIGDLLNARYKVVRKLGWGSYSTVWLSWDIHDEKYVAVKISRTGEDIFNFTAEREIMMLNSATNSSIDNPRRNAVVQLLDNFKFSGVNGTHICLVFEVMGNDLREFLDVPLPEAKKIIKQVLEILDYLHTERRIIHTDVKPENIFTCESDNYAHELAAEVGFKPTITNKLNWSARLLQTLRIKKKNKITLLKEEQKSNDVTVKLGDLGTACWIDYHFEEKIQTRTYRAPEVILGANYGTSADIWSVACMVFEFATGNILFEPNETDEYTIDDEHLARMMIVLGKMPKHIALSGKYSDFFFTEHGELRRINVVTSSLVKVLIEKQDFDKKEACELAEFLLPMLDFDPEKRPTARDCINHFWLQS